MALSFGDRVAWNELRNEEFPGCPGGFSLGDGEDVADDGAGELGGIGKVVAGLWEEVVEPRFGGDSDEGEVAGDGALLLG